MQIGRPNIETLAISSSRVDSELKLEELLAALVVGGFVVDDGECSLLAVLFVEDYVGAAGDDAAVDVEGEGALGGPDALEIVGVLVDVALDDAARRALHLVEGAAVRERQEELLLHQPLELRRRRRL